MIRETVLAAKARSEELSREVMSAMCPLDGRILVTGGAGFIGSALVWALNRRGRRDIVVADFLEPGKRWRDAVPLSPGAEASGETSRRCALREFVEADEFRAAIAADPGAFGRFSAVFHLGACSSTTETNAAYLRRRQLVVHPAPGGMGARPGRALHLCLVGGDLRRRVGRAWTTGTRTSPDCGRSTSTGSRSRTSTCCAQSGAGSAGSSA